MRGDADAGPAVASHTLIYHCSVAGGKENRLAMVPDVIKQERHKELQFNIATPQLYSK